MKALKKLMATIMLLCIIMGLTGGYIFYVEPLKITVRQIETETEKPLPTGGITIVQFSDTHLSESFSLSQLEKIVKKINEEQPDIVVFTGDLVDRMAGYEDRDSIAPVLEKINAPLGKFSVWGNHDYGGGGVRFYEEIMDDSGFTLLENESVVLPVGDGTEIEVTGLDDAFFGTPDTAVLPEAEPENTFELLLVHEPDIADDLAKNTFDLVAAGHSHGGQIWLPGYGPLIKTRLAEKYTRGLYNLGDVGRLYVNPGLGTTKVKARWFNPPELTVFKIKTV